MIYLLMFFETETFNQDGNDSAVLKKNITIPQI